MHSSLPPNLAPRAEYAIALQMSLDARRHSEGSGIETLLQQRFPSEPLEIHRYRLQNLRPITRTYFDKVLNALACMQRAQGLGFQCAEPALEHYLRHQNPDGYDMFEWFFSTGLRVSCTEPNGLLAIVPNGLQPKGLPVLRYFRAESVRQYTPGQWALVALPDAPDTYLMFTPNSLHIYQANTRQATELWRYPQPAFAAVLCGGELLSLRYPNVYRSFLSGAFAFWDEALVQFSEKQAGIKQHLFPEKWQFALEECKHCEGMGKMRHGGTIVDCAACNGSGRPAITGVFSVLSVPVPREGRPNLPMPPAGYIQKDFSAIEFLNKDIDANLYKGLAALNCEFLTESPLATSGISKAMDRQELNTFMYKIAHHIVYQQFLPLCKAVLRILMPGLAVSNARPTVFLPQNFEHLPTNLPEDNLRSLQSPQLNPVLRRALEQQYIAQQFAQQPEYKNRLHTYLQLQPFPGTPPETLLQLYANQAISYPQLYLALHIESLCNQAANETNDFFSLPLNQQLPLVQALLPTQPPKLPDA